MEEYKVWFPFPEGEGTKWVHLCCIFDGELIRYYKDGELITTKSIGEFK